MKIAGKIALVLMTLSTGLMGIYGYIEISRAETQARDDDARNYRNAIANGAPVVAKILWDLDERVAKAALANLFETGDVQKVQIFDEKGVLFYGSDKRSDGEIYPMDVGQKLSEVLPGLQDGKPAHNFVESAVKRFSPPISLGSEKWRLVGTVWKEEEAKLPTLVGHVVMEYSTLATARRISSMKMRVIAWVLCLGIAQSLVSFIFLKRMVINPVSNLMASSVDLIKGKFTKVKPRKAVDEIGLLTLNFNKMVDALKANIDNLRILAFEGQRLSNSKSLAALTESVKMAFHNVTGVDVHAKIIFRAELLPVTKPDGFYEITVEDKAVSYQLKSAENMASKNRNSMVVRSASDSSIIAYVITDLPNPADRERLLLAFESLRVYVSHAIETIRFMKDHEAQARMAAELDTASAVQQQLLPAVSNPKIGHFEIESFFKSASECGGDWWNYYPLPDGNVLILLGDVTGHGTASALVAAVVKGYCDSIYWKDKVEPDVLLRELSVLVRSCTHGRMLMTMFATVLDPTNEVIYYSNAGHTHPFIISREKDASDRNIRRLLSIGSRLGDRGSDVSYGVFEIKTAPFYKGETLVIFSDGLIEGENSEGRAYSERKMTRLFAGMSGKSALEIKEALLRDACAFYGDVPPGDDITFVVANFKADKQLNEQNADPRSKTEMFKFAQRSLEA